MSASRTSVALLSTLLLVSTLAAPLLIAPAAASQSNTAASQSNTTAVDRASNPCVGTVSRPANGITVISVQGMRFGENGGKRQAKLIGVGPRGEVQWVFRPDNVVWGYDVDPLDDGTLFVTSTVREHGEGKTVFYKFDPRTGQVIWSEVADFLDTHDADLLDSQRILVANMRATENTSGNRDRLLIYNRTTDQIEWQWRFSEHYPRSVGGNYSEDWTHVNDVDRVAPGEYLASPRNLDQVILVNRSTGRIDLRLGRDGDHSILNAQHNPVYLESENGTPTLLVADSDNDRIVEYAKRGDGWDRTWTLGSKQTLSWPRDADRLPNGNTLVGDSRNDRVIEVTPDGEVVWEFYAPWLVYDVERVAYGDEAGGPTIADQGATGSVPITGAANVSTADEEACAVYLNDFENDYANATTGRDGTNGDGGGSDNGAVGRDANAETTTAGDGPIGGGLSMTALAAGVALAAAAALGASLTGRRED